MRSILLTGFEPFGSVHHNPSSAVLPLLPDSIDGAAVHKAVLPVDTEGVAEVLAQLFSKRFDAVVHCGVADDRPVITVERQARNRLEFKIPDNRGVLRRGCPVVADGPELHPSRLPVESILRRWSTARIEARASDSAGAYLCNQVMYTSLHALPPSVPAGFIHLPPDETLGSGRAHQPLTVQAEALTLALEVVVRETLKR